MEFTCTFHEIEPCTSLAHLVAQNILTNTIVLGCTDDAIAERNTHATPAGTL